MLSGRKNSQNFASISALDKNRAFELRKNESLRKLNGPTSSMPDIMSYQERQTSKTINTSTRAHAKKLKSHDMNLLLPQSVINKKAVLLQNADSRFKKNAQATINENPDGNYVSDAADYLRNTLNGNSAAETQPKNEKYTPNYEDHHLDIIATKQNVNRANRQRPPP